MKPSRSLAAACGMAVTLWAGPSAAIPTACPGVPSVFVTVEIYDDVPSTPQGRQAFLIEGQRITTSGSSTDARVVCGAEQYGTGFDVAETQFASLSSLATLLAALRDNDALTITSCTGGLSPYPVEKVTVTVFKVPGDITATNTFTYSRGGLGACDVRMQNIEAALQAFFDAMPFAQGCSF